MQHRPNNECFWQKNFKITTTTTWVKWYCSLLFLIVLFKFLNDARGRNKIKVEFNYFSLWKRLLKIVWKDNMGQTILSLLRRTLIFENRVNAEFYMRRLHETWNEVKPIWNLKPLWNSVYMSIYMEISLRQLSKQ